MIYLDNGATSFHKPLCVADGVRRAMFTCANPGRGGYKAAMTAAKTVFTCRQRAAELFDCLPEQVVFTPNCTQGLNIAINSLTEPGDTVLITGFEHNAVTRPLYARGNKVLVAGRKLFDWEEMLESWERALQKRPKAAVFTHCSNVFGYILPVEQMAALCRRYQVPFIVDAAQSAGALPVSLKKWGAEFIAMPGHKGLLGPQGTGLLLCSGNTKPLVCGGTGSNSLLQEMPDFLPDRLEAGTLNVPGIAGLEAGLSYLQRTGIDRIFQAERKQAAYCAGELKKIGLRVFSGEHQSGTVSFVADMDCEDVADALARQNIAVRAGLHCAPLAHQSAGTDKTGTVRISFGCDASAEQVQQLCKALGKIIR